MKQLNNPQLNDLVELLEFAFSTVAAIQQAKANDGKIDLKDFPLLWPVIMSASPAFSGLDNILPAWKSSTEEDRALVLEIFKDRFDLPNDELEASIEKLLQAGLLIAEVVFKLK